MLVLTHLLIITSIINTLPFFYGRIPFRLRERESSQDPEETRKVQRVSDGQVEDRDQHIWQQ